MIILDHIHLNMYGIIDGMLQKLLIEREIMTKKKMDRCDFIRSATITGAGLALGGGLLYGRRALATLLGGEQGDIDRAVRDVKLGQMSEAEAQAVVEA